MQIPILNEQVEGNGYRACGVEPLVITAEGGTQEEAIANLRKKFQTRLRGGAVVVPLDLLEEPHPLAEFVGIFKGDPLIMEWKKSMKEYRRNRDKDADKP